ncbi:hypothetical protein HWV62_11958 [Athelia sp. TMB]|nr:hypothetical protein HWV62_11958 [Athelia sp. TMB]
MNTQSDTLDSTVRLLRSRGMTPADFFTGLLESQSHFHHVRELFVEHPDLLLAHPNTYSGAATLMWAQRLMEETYTHEMLALSNKSAGLQFRASKADVAQVAVFSLEDIGARMCGRAPALWELLGALLSADAKATQRRLEEGKAAAKRVRKFLQGEKVLDLEGDELMTAAAEIEVDDGAESEAEYWRDTVLLMEAPSSAEMVAECNKTLNTIKKIMCLSVLVQSTNHRCNALQSIIGVFLQSAGAPETVVKLLSQLGVSLTTSSINNMVNNLSKDMVLRGKPSGATRTESSLLHRSRGDSSVLVARLLVSRTRYTHWFQGGQIRTLVRPASTSINYAKVAKPWITQQHPSYLPYLPCIWTTSWISGKRKAGPSCSGWEAKERRAVAAEQWLAASATTASVEKVFKKSNGGKQSEWTKGDILDCGLDIDALNRPQYSLKTPLYKRSELVVRQMQNILDAAYQLIGPQERTVYRIDPEDLMLQTLQGTSSFFHLNQAWKTLLGRLERAQHVFDQYVLVYQKELESLQSPSNTNQAIYDSLPAQRGNLDAVFDHMYKNVPSLRSRLSESVAARLDSGESLHSMLGSPIHLREAFSPRRPEKNPPQRYYNSKGGKITNGPHRLQDLDLEVPITQTDGHHTRIASPPVASAFLAQEPLSGDSASSFRMPRKPNSAGSSDSGTGSQGYGSAARPDYASIPSRPSTANHDLLFGSASAVNPTWMRRGAIPAKEESTTSALGGRILFRPAWPKVPPDLPPGPNPGGNAGAPGGAPGGYGREPSGPGGNGPGGPPQIPTLQGPPYQSRGPSAPYPTGGSGGGGGYGGGGGGSGGPPPGGGGAVNFPVGIPYEKGPSIRLEIKPEQLPSWDGEYDTTIQYFHELQEIAALGGSIPDRMGFWLFRTLKAGSGVAQWYATLAADMKTWMREHYSHYIQAIQHYYLGCEWQQHIQLKYQRQTFRQSGHETESPHEFIM